MGFFTECKIKIKHQRHIKSYNKKLTNKINRRERSEKKKK